MADWEEQEPGEHHVRLLKFLLAGILLYLMCPCVSCAWRWDRELAVLTGLTGRQAQLVLFFGPQLLVFPLSVTGFVLARSVSSRLLFVGTALIGFVLLYLATLFYW